MGFNIIALILRFRISSHTMNSHLVISKRDFIKISYSYAKFIFSSVAYLYFLTIQMCFFSHFFNITNTSKMSKNFVEIPSEINNGTN